MLYFFFLHRPGYQRSCMAAHSMNYSMITRCVWIKGLVLLVKWKSRHWLWSRGVQNTSVSVSAQLLKSSWLLPLSNIKGSRWYLTTSSLTFTQDRLSVKDFDCQVWLCNMLPPLRFHSSFQAPPLHLSWQISIHSHSSAPPPHLRHPSIIMWTHWNTQPAWLSRHNKVWLKCEFHQASLLPKHNCHSTRHLLSQKILSSFDIANY